MAQNFRQRLLKQFIILNVSLGVPLLLGLLLLGSMIPRSQIGTLTAATAAQIAETISTNLALKRISLSPEYSIEGHRRQTQPVFYPIASKTREALVKRAGNDFFRRAVENYIATDIQLVITQLSGKDAEEHYRFGTVVASLESKQIGDSFDYARFGEGDINPDIVQVEIGETRGSDEDLWSAFAPVFDGNNNTVAMVVVHSDMGFINKLDWIGSLVVIVLVGVLVGISAYFASRIAARIHHPIKSLHDGMLELASGNFSVRLPFHNTGDELDDLINHFNQTSQQLKEHLAMMQAMEMAAEIQTKLLPTEYPDIHQYDLAASLTYAEMAGGDYYDFIHLTEHNEVTSKWLVVLGDVTGHGVSAALLVAWLRATIRALAREYQDDLVSLVKALNASMLQDMNTGKFVTLFLAVVDGKDNQVTWLSAGHDPARLYRGTGSAPELLEACGPPVGVIATATWERPAPVTMAAHDLLLLLTDGMQDAKDPHGKRLGLDAVDRTVHTQHKMSADSCCLALSNILDSHRQGQSLADDVTFVLLKRTL